MLCNSYYCLCRQKVALNVIFIHAMAGGSHALTVGHAVLSIILHGSTRESCASKAQKTLPMWGVCWMCTGGLRGVQQLQGQEEVWGSWEEEAGLQCKEVYAGHEGCTST